MGYFFISESFAFKWCIFAALANKKLLLPLYFRLKQNFLLYLEKLIEYWASAVSIVSSNACVGPLTRIKISFLLLLICIDELISTPKLMIFLPTLPSGDGNSERESNLIP